MKTEDIEKLDLRKFYIRIKDSDTEKPKTRTQALEEQKSIWKAVVGIKE